MPFTACIIFIHTGFPRKKCPFLVNLPFFLRLPEYVVKYRWGSKSNGSHFHYFFISEISYWWWTGWNHQKTKKHWNDSGRHNSTDKRLKYRTMQETFLSLLIFFIWKIGFYLTFKLKIRFGNGIRIIF